MTATTAPAAVFLSYASQDAEAARRLAEALRAAGVEVWFDQNELVGGDAWDAKIRAQIAACTLFVPLISAATQSRLEGYFRLEWRLAEHRSHLMAKGRPFLLPVVIDGTREPEAQVPDGFRDIQWTRLDQPGAEARFIARVHALLKRLLSPTATATATDAPTPEPKSPPPATSSTTPAARRLRRYAPHVAALLLLSLAGLAARFLLHRPPAADAPSPPAASAPLTADNPELRRAAALLDLNTVDTNRADFDLAEQILDRELARHPTHPRAVILNAWLQNAYLLRGFDASDARFGKARQFSERAMQLAPDDPEAVGALGFYHYTGWGDLGTAEQLLRRAIALQPRQPKYHRLLGWVLHEKNKGEGSHGFPATSVQPAPAVRLMSEAAAAFPSDALVRYDLAMLLFSEEDYSRALAELDAALALAPISTALRDRAWMALWWEGRPADMAGWLDRTPGRFRSEDIAIIARYLEAAVTGRVEPAVSFLRGMPTPWLQDYSRVPKNFLLGELLQLQGKPQLARIQFEAALGDLARARAETPTEISLRQFEAWTLLHLGRIEESRALLSVLTEADLRFASPQRGLLFWFGPFQLSLLLDDVPSALRILRAQATTPNRRQLLRNLLRFDPRLARWRDDPAINALLAEPAPSADSVSSTAPAPAAPDASVAVLAFANLSSDAENEYFSDGISEELLNALARVPGLKVSARTSAFHFKGKDIPVPEIARQLGVAYVVEGSVRKSGDKVRITAQLIKASDGFQVWSEIFTRDLRDVFAVQDEIAGVIARKMSLQLGAESRRETPDLRAFELYVQARQLWNQRTLPAYDRAEQILAQALAIDPRFARAHAALADVWSMRGQALDTTTPWGRRDGEEVARIIAKCQEALALDPDSAEARASLGLIYWNAWRPQEALRELREAVRLNPNYASARQWLGRQLLLAGHPQEALWELRRASELDPLSARILDNYAWALLLAGRREEARIQLDRALNLQPDAGQAIGLKAVLLVESGAREEGASLARTISKTDSTTAWLRFIALALAGHSDEVKAELPTLIEGNDYAAFSARLALGETDEALRRVDANWLTSTRADWLLLHPLYDQIGEDPRFKSLLKAVDLSEARDQAEAWLLANPTARVGSKL